MRTLFSILTGFIVAAAFGQPRLKDNCRTNTDAKTKVTYYTYPFNKATRILLVKYKAAAVQGKPKLFSWDTAEIIPKTGKDPDTSKFLSKQQLTKSGIDSLLEIINRRSNNKPVIEGIFVEPSNALLFLDKKGNIFEYIVICLSQIGAFRNYTEMSRSHLKVNLGRWCKEKGQLLTDLFLQRGIDVVVTKWE